MGGENMVPQKSAETVETREELAVDAGPSSRRRGILALGGGSVPTWPPPGDQANAGAGMAAAMGLGSTAIILMAGMVESDSGCSPGHGVDARSRTTAPSAMADYPAQDARHGQTGSRREVGWTRTAGAWHGA